MDGAAGRVNLRGMGLLHGRRERRERDMMAEVTRRLDAVRRAALDREQVREAQEAQRRAWRESEHEFLTTMQDAEMPSGRLRAHWLEMDRQADEARQLQTAYTAAQAGQVRAEAMLADARGSLRQAARLVQRSNKVMERVQLYQMRAAETAEQADIEEDALGRFMARQRG